MSKLTRIFCATGLIMGMGSAAWADEQGAETVIATVNGTAITLGHVIVFRELLPEQYQELADDILFNGIVEQLIQQEILAAAIAKDMNKRNSLGMENEGRAFRASSMLERIGGAKIGDEAIQAAYAQAYLQGDAESEFNAAHILVATEDEAKELVAALEGGAEFEGLAREKSTGPSGPNGGNLGWLSEGRTVRPFEDAVMALEVGQISAPVQTEFGWHVIKLLERRVKAAPKLDEVRAEIEQELVNAAVQAEIGRLTAAAEINRADVEIDPAQIRNGALVE